MASISPKAKCSLCGGRYTGRGMTKHLSRCIPKTLGSDGTKAGNTVKRFMHLLVKGSYHPEYWMHLKVAGDSRLEDLDAFLRAIWLECCGHMSAFSIDRDQLRMGQQLRHALWPGLELTHQYDFGSTTELLIRVVGVYDGGMPVNEPVQIIARNDPPEILCDECGEKPAAEICMECQWDGGGWLCLDCAQDHECSEDFFLPVLNSPRTGVCGYTG